jgi:hypothetical protein
MNQNAIQKPLPACMEEEEEEFLIMAFNLEKSRK